MADYLVPTVRLVSALLEYIRLAPRTTDELCSHFGYSASAIRHRLHILEDKDLIHFQKMVYTNGGGSYYVWHAGVRTTIAAARVVPLARPAQYAPIVIGRDPLVAALFGAPAKVPQVSA